MVARIKSTCCVSIRRLDSASGAPETISYFLDIPSSSENMGVEQKTKPPYDHCNSLTLQYVGLSISNLKQQDFYGEPISL